jgi:hypothetical protein
VDPDDFARRVMGSFPPVTPGERLYQRWCGSRRTDRARYYRMMNPAEKAAWEDVAADLIEQDADVFERVVRNIPEPRPDGATTRLHGVDR